MQNEATRSTNMRPNHISQTSAPLNTSGGQKTQRGKKWWSQTRTSNNKQSIKSVGGGVSWGGGAGVCGKADFRAGGGGRMRVYLKHGDPVAEGSLGAGMNKTLMAHKTQPAPSRPGFRAPLPARAGQSRPSHVQTQDAEEKKKGGF